MCCIFMNMYFSHQERAACLKQLVSESMNLRGDFHIFLGTSGVASTGINSKETHTVIRFEFLPSAQDIFQDKVIVGCPPLACHLSYTHINCALISNILSFYCSAF